MPVHQGLTFIALIAVVALICGIALTRLRQPAIVGYIIAGVVLGPTGFGLVEDRDQIALLAELGVLLLLFLIGMELSLRAFKRALRIALFGTALQIAVGLAVMLVLSQFLGWRIELAVLLGFAVALSSTAVAVKMLEDIDELRGPVGRNAIGILIAQDLAVVPMMLALNAMASETGFDLWTLLPMTLAAAVLALFVWYLSRRQRIALPLARWVVGDHDLTPLAALAYCFAAATASGLLGLSAAYGAFLAGLLIGNSTDRQTMIQATRPVQSLLMMVFFLSIGLLIDLDYIWANLGAVLVLLLVVTLGKTALNIAILRLLREPWPSAFLTGVVLGQVGEFSFLLAALGLGNGLIDTEGYRLVVTVIVLSLVISPLWLALARRMHALATTGISTLNELMTVLYPDETAAMRETADHAARGARRLALAAAARWRAFRARRASKPPAAPPADPPETPPENPSETGGAASPDASSDAPPGAGDAPPAKRAGE